MKENVLELKNRKPGRTHPQNGYQSLPAGKSLAALNRNSMTISSS